MRNVRLIRLFPIVFLSAFLHTTQSQAATQKAVGYATANLVTAKVDVSAKNSKGEDLTYEIPLDSVNLSSDRYNSILTGEKDLAYKINFQSNSVINVRVASDASGKSGSRSLIVENDNNEYLPIKLTNGSGEVIDARIKVGETVLISDKNGQSKLQIKIEIPPGKIKPENKGAYKATYNVIIQN